MKEKQKPVDFEGWWLLGGTGACFYEAGLPEKNPAYCDNISGQQVLGSSPIL